jgi:hypothetical protein
MNYIICSKHVYTYVEDYIASILQIIHAIVVPHIHYEDTNNYICIQDIPNNLLHDKPNVYLFNIEQLSSTSKFNYHMLRYQNYTNIKIIDYSSSNMVYYNHFQHKKFLLPYQLNVHEILNLNKEKNVCLIGDDYIPPTRQYIIDILKSKNIHVDIINGFGKTRDEKLFEYKIILNISYCKDFNIFESIRCDRCVYNKMIVISDIKQHIENHHLKDYVIFEDYENIPNKVADVITNYEYYYDKLFKNFDFEQISTTIHELSNEVIEQLKIS